jgi:hypothetical protein
MEFAEFLAPFDAGTFRSQYFGKQPLHVRRKGAGVSLLPWRRFNEVLALTPYWNEESLKVYFKSRAALRENYCDTADLRPGAPAPVNPAKVKALMGLGASLVANQLHRVCPEVGAVARCSSASSPRESRPADLACLEKAGVIVATVMQ